LINDVAFYLMFRHVRPPEEEKRSAVPAFKGSTL
jgi:hypothetical protein